MIAALGVMLLLAVADQDQPPTFRAATRLVELTVTGLNTPPQYSTRVRALAVRYLKALAPRTRMAVYHMSNQLRVLHDFTDDAEALRARIEKTALALPLQMGTDFTRSIIEAEQLVDMFQDPDNPIMEALVADMVRSQLELEAMNNSTARRERLDRTLASC